MNESTVYKSGTATLLKMIAYVVFIVAAIAGLAVVSESVGRGFIVFISAALSGVFLLGFARVIEYLYETTQRLSNIESIMRWKWQAEDELTDVERLLLVNLTDAERVAVANKLKEIHSTKSSGE